MHELGACTACIVHVCLLFQLASNCAVAVMVSSTEAGNDNIIEIWHETGLSVAFVLEAASPFVCRLSRTDANDLETRHGQLLAIISCLFPFLVAVPRRRPSYKACQ